MILFEYLYIIYVNTILTYWIIKIEIHYKFTTLYFYLSSVIL